MSCDAYVARFERRLATIPRDFMQWDVPSDIRPPQALGEPFLATGAQVVLDARGGLRFDGLQVESIAENWAVYRRNFRIIHAGADQAPSMLVWVDGDTKMRAVQDLLAGVQGDARLMVTSPLTSDVPACPPGLGRLCHGETVDPSERAVAIAEAESAAIRHCVSLIRTFSAIAGVDADHKADVFRAHAADDLRSCDCAVDRVSFEYVSMRLVVGYGPRVTSLSLDDVGSVDSEETVQAWAAAHGRASRR